MKASFFTVASVVAANAGLGLATPLVKRADDSAPNATQILQFALTLEHLESTFYTQGLQNFTQQDFENAGFPSWVYGRVNQISQHEAAHVQTLTKALGADAVNACTYDFPYTDPKSFVTLAFLLESVGDSAYIGASQYLVSDPEALTVAASILSMEGRHSGWINSAALHSYPWSSSFDTALEGNSVYTLASSFIVSCPSTNPTLPFSPYPALNISNADTSSLSGGENVTVSYVNTTTDSEQYLALFHGLNTTIVPISDSQAQLPDGIQGIAYAVITTNSSSASNGSIIAGPAIFQFPFGSSASNI